MVDYSVAYAFALIHSVMKNLKLYYLKIALIILVIYMLDLYLSKDRAGALLLIAAIVFIEFIFGDLFSEEAKKLSLKGAKFSSILTLSAMLLPVYTLFIFGVNYLIDNSSGSFVLLTAALFYGAIFLHGYAVHVVKLHSRKK